MRTILAAAAASLVALVAPAQATVELHAHRGGPLQNGVPTAPENSLPAFANAWDLGVDVIELDAKLTSDNVPVIMHDATLDRTTDCQGEVAAHTAAQVAACRIDILGTTGRFRELPESSVHVPTLAQALEWAKSAGARLNLEIKNQPTDPDFEPGPAPAFARTVVQGIEQSGIAKRQVLIQSFWPPNLDVAKAAGLQTSFLTLQQANEPGPEFARSNAYNWISPGWPLSNPRDYVRRAHAAGLEVVPYTLDARDTLNAAEDAGVDAVISNDPVLAMDTVATPACTRAANAHRDAQQALRDAKARLRAATTRAGRSRAARAVRKARRRADDARRARGAVCPGRF